jgi:hypothetical protein
VAIADDGALVATVSKKRRGNAITTHFDISIGEGQFISLSDPDSVKNLDDNTKKVAILQVQVLQDQMEVLMEQLTTEDTESKK